LTDESIQGSQTRKWAPVLAIVIAVALIAVYYVMVIMPVAPVPVQVPVNSEDVSPPVATAAAQHTIQWENDCSYPVWVNIVGGKQWNNTKGVKVGACGIDPDGACNPYTRCDQVKGCTNGDPLVDGGGFKLEATGGKHTSTVIPLWQGGFWGRTGCSGSDGNQNCDWKTCYGTDGKGKLQCGGAGSSQMTKGEINFDENGYDTYDVSAVDGFNVPMTITPIAGTYVNKGKDTVYDCTASGTTYDLKDPKIFPSTLSKDLIVNVSKKPAAVLSACQYSVYKDKVENPAYCCVGSYGTPGTCKPSTWPENMRTDKFFKQYLPGAYSYAFDDHTSTYTCWNKDAVTMSSYKVTFCGTKTGSIADAGQPVQTILPVNTPGQVVTIPPTALPTQTAVPNAPYNPAASGGNNY
jgi:hypothetical protein